MSTRPYFYAESNGGGGQGRHGLRGERFCSKAATDYFEHYLICSCCNFDIRNHYEAAIGRFDGQMQGEDDSTNKGSKEEGNDGSEAAAAANTNADGSSGGGGAEYIDPKMRKSTDFTSWLAEPQTKKKLEGKTVMMFCTGE